MSPAANPMTIAPRGVITISAVAPTATPPTIYIL